MRLARLHRRRVPLGSFFRRTGQAACIVWPTPGFARGPDAVRRARTVASGTAPMSPRETAAMNEPEMSRTARADGDAVQTQGLAEGSGAGTEVDLLISGGGGLAALLPRRLVTGWARGRSLMRVRALQAQPDARSRPRWRRWLLVAGDAALALALAAAFYLATGVHYDDRRVGVALILLQTLPLAVRRWRPVWVLAVVVAATLATMAAEIPGRSNGGVGVVFLVALYSVAAHCPRRQAAWAGIAAGAVLAWPLWTATGGIAPVWARLVVVVVSLGFPALG